MDVAALFAVFDFFQVKRIRLEENFLLTLNEIAIY
jgi:hypothetical protein